MDLLSIEMLITPAGTVVAGTLVTGLVEVIKKALPAVDQRVSGAQIAFISSAMLYILTALALNPITPDMGLQIFASWLTVAGVAMGVKAGADHVQEMRS